MRSRPDSTQAPIPLFTPEPDKPQANVQVRRARPDSTLAPIPVRTDRPYSTLAPIPIDELYEEPRQEIFRHEDGVHVDDPPPYAYELEELTGSASQSGETGVTSDGRILIDLDSRLARTLVKLVPEQPKDLRHQPSRRLTVTRLWTIRLNIVIQVVGSRGDVQPFVALGQELQRYGHRVRLATHNTFEAFVLESGLEFYPIGGDPKELMAYMVKNPGLIPSMKSLRQGDIQRKREMVAEMLTGCWKSCIEADLKSQQPFVADAIIANPPSFAHIHCAQALGIPVHMMFTMPWSSTRSFPHPLANFVGDDVKKAALNYASYGVVEFLTWQGLGDVINEFRHSLDLEAIPNTVGPLLAESLKVPFTYCWSPALVPKPADWPSYIDVCGFFFREAPAYQPTEDIDRFLSSGPPPVYIGFGSIVIEDPVKMTNMILEAVKILGLRAIISRGWSNLGEGLASTSENVLFIGDCPHEWLFQYVSAVVHHGGAGTAACGLRNACPTSIVPFFGDQPFWGNMVAAAGAGPKPIPHKLLTTQNLTDAISFCLTPSAKAAAQSIASRMATEQGVYAAVQSFHANLPLETMKCAILPYTLASWTYKKGSNPIHLSKLTAQILIENGIIFPTDLSSYQTDPIAIVNNRWDPITSTGAASFGIVGDIGRSTKTMLVEPFSEMKRSDSEGKNGAVTAGRMVATSAKGFGKFNMALFKGTIVDLPLATTEGFRNVSRLYGEEPKSHGEVTGIMSGLQVGAKNFAHGMYDGFTDPFKQTYENGKKEGAIGAAKGFGKGMAGFMTKTSSALVGIVAYPGDGICKSIRHATHKATRREIKVRKMIEGEWLARKNELDVDVTGVIDAFERAVGKGKEREKDRTVTWH